MQGVLVQTTLFGEEDLNSIIRSSILGKNLKAIGSQPLKFKKYLLVFVVMFVEDILKLMGIDRELCLKQILQ
ncbi:Uncharacterised protein [uncultured archaeon]|nr:Uncharacterised protein [uncultured archaeon]